MMDMHSGACYRPKCAFIDMKKILLLVGVSASSMPYTLWRWRVSPRQALGSVAQLVATMSPMNPCGAPSAS
jgi:hypothetical protein